MKIKNRTLIAFLVISITGFAQSKEDKFAIGLDLKKTEYSGDFGNGLFNFNKFSYFSGGLSFQYYLSPSFDLGFSSTYGNYGYIKNEVDNFDGRKLQIGLFTHYKFANGYLLNDKSRLLPFISFGVGAASYGINEMNDKSGIIAGVSPNIDVDGVDLVLPVGLGLKYKITNNFAVQYQYLYTFTNADNHDQIKGASAAVYTGKKGNDAFGEHSLSFVFNFGKGKDRDKDGVPDKKDKCNDTPAFVTVDKDGCPADSDNDGVLDYLDNCNDTPAGVRVDKNGCAIDTDNDGVPDYQDRCPDEKGLVAFGGCPDTDGDGIPDKIDNCPSIPGVESAGGCPDSDGDGITDSEDNCPTVAGVLKNGGCPEMKVDEMKLLEQAMYGIQFEMGSDVIKDFSYSFLNRIVSVLKDNSVYKLEINCYTDYLGDDIENLILTQGRANSIKIYLQNKGVESARLLATGHGEKDPIATNYTEAGRAKNRRVELKIFY